MGNRKLPFGYQMRMGEIVRREPEAKAVQDIFLQYTLGASLKEIAEQMSKTGPTYDTGKSWNKNMVARILENPKYTGVDNYPKLVDIKLFEAAAAKRQTSKRTTVFLNTGGAGQRPERPATRRRSSQKADLPAGAGAV